MEQVREIGRWEMIDFIEVSGGDYENPGTIFHSYILYSGPSTCFTQVPLIQEFAKRSSPRQAFFSRFARQAMATLPSSPKSPVIMLTGSLRNRPQFANSIRNKHANLIGVARPSVLCPNLPQVMLSEKPEEAMPNLVGPILTSPSWLPKFINASTETAWYAYGLRTLALGGTVKTRTTLFFPLLNMYCLELGVFAVIVLVLFSILIRHLY